MITLFFIHKNKVFFIFRETFVILNLWKQGLLLSEIFAVFELAANFESMETMPFLFSVRFLSLLNPS